MPSSRGGQHERLNILKLASSLYAVLVALVAVVAVACHSGSGTHASSSGTSPGTSSPSGRAAPSPTASSTPSSTPAQGSAAVPVSSVQWAAATYPFQCDAGPEVYQLVYATPQPGTQLALVVVGCKSGAGTPPRAFLVFDGAASPTQPHLAQTLFTREDNWLDNGPPSAAGAHLSLRVYGYSSANQCRACIDISRTLNWVWTNGAYQLTAPEPSHYQLPPVGS